MNTTNNHYDDNINNDKSTKTQGDHLNNAKHNNQIVINY